jgi:hypothetical protein
MWEFFGEFEFYLRRGLTLIEIWNTVDRKIGLPDKGNDESCSENREKYRVSHNVCNIFILHISRLREMIKCSFFCLKDVPGKALQQLYEKLPF